MPPFPTSVCMPSLMEARSSSKHTAWRAGKTSPSSPSVIFSYIDAAIRLASCPIYETRLIRSLSESDESSLSLSMIEPLYAWAPRNNLQSDDLPQATGPVIPMIDPQCAVKSTAENNGLFSGQANDTLCMFTRGYAVLS